MISHFSQLLFSYIPCCRMKARMGPNPTILFRVSPWLTSSGCALHLVFLRQFRMLFGEDFRKGGAVFFQFSNGHFAVGAGMGPEQDPSFVPSGAGHLSGFGGSGLHGGFPEHRPFSRRFFFLQMGLAQVVDFPVLEFLDLPVVPVLDRPVIAGDPAVDFGLFAAVGQVYCSPLRYPCSRQML